MCARIPPAFTGRHIVVADEDRRIVDMILQTLRDDGHAVFHAYDVLSATQLAMGLGTCDLVICNTKVEGSDGVELILYLRKRLPTLPIIYLANLGRSSPEAEAQLPEDVPILREPFTVRNLREAVAPILNGKAANGSRETGEEDGIRDPLDAYSCEP